jgi:hypothetical protein
MSFFGRAANLIKGGVKSIGRPSADAAARERALEEELARMDVARERPARRAAGGGAPAEGGAGRPEPEAPAPSRGPPERDENGDVKRTL